MLARNAEALIFVPSGFVHAGWLTQPDYIFHGAMQASLQLGGAQAGGGSIRERSEKMSSVPGVKI